MSTGSKPPGISIPGWLATVIAGLVLGGILASVIPMVFRKVPEPNCATHCGLRAYGTEDCEALAAFESKVLAAFERNVAGWAAAQTCPALKGWALQVVFLDGGLTNWAHERVAGQVYLRGGVIQVEGGHSWPESALSHEMAHVFEALIDKREDYRHEGWEARGIRQAINEAGR